MTAPRPSQIPITIMQHDIDRRLEQMANAISDLAGEIVRLRQQIREIQQTSLTINVDSEALVKALDRSGPHGGKLASK